RFALSADTDFDGLPDCLDFDNDGDGIIDDFDSDGLADMPLIRGPWDVDNDGDGVMDSIWVDLGAPIKTSPDGRMYKPLYAILCVDMDGRININAAGSREQVNLLASRQSISSGTDSLAAGGTGDISQVMLGQGYGPAELRMDELMAPFAAYFNMLPKVTGLVNERYLSPEQFETPFAAPGLPEVTAAAPVPMQYPTLPTEALLHTFQNWGLAGDYLSPSLGEGDLYQTPPDLHGVGSVYLDLRGQARYANMTNIGSLTALGQLYQVNGGPYTGLPYNAMRDNPYEFNLVTTQGNDSAYTDHDLEVLLRYNDMEELRSPTRLINIFELTPPVPAANMLQSLALRRRMTTRSFEVPTAPGVFPDNGERVATGMSIVELARLRLVRHNTSLASDPVALEQFLTLQLSLLLSPEIREGKKFDINRLIGNGIDDDGDLIVDEPTESLNTTTGKVEEAVWPGTAFETRPVQFGGIDPNFEDATRGIDNSSNPIFSRQLLARYLYCLAYLAMDDNFEIEVASGDAKEITARRLAQWAINVVDFRDPDAIMTPFEYDVDPFDDNGWNVDDNYATVQAFEQADRRIVWGCESPELLITESKAIHDRRVRDTDLDVADPNDSDNPQDFTKRTETDPMTIDATLDQFRIPQGSLFLELMATGNEAQNLSTANGALGLPAELYTNGLLDLTRLATDGTNFSPVWRIAITRPSNPASPVTTIANVMADPPRLAVLGPALAQLPLPYDDTFLALLNDPSLGLRFDSVASPSGLPENQASQLYDRYIVFTGDPLNAATPLTLPEVATEVRRRYY
ncbi:MAG: hypothetical protein KDA92_22660, partial [Planctomycetales bacterium]|nr:hypothetical protein [Planctomycetales bacterium]